jgi:hypothetical protein
MAEVINLRQARKSKARASKEATAEQNRIRFGQTKGEKAARRQEEQRQKGVHDGLRRETGTVEGEGEQGEQV